MSPLRPNLPPLPRRIAALPVDKRGYPVPWFVQWINGEPDFRVMDRIGEPSEAIWYCEGRPANARSGSERCATAAAGFARSARLLATRLLETRASAICDLYEMNRRDRHEWVRLFLEGLIEAPKKLRHPVLVIVDEAHIFCPEKGKGESSAGEMMIALCTRGRKRLLCPLFATQRLATLSKDASSMLMNRLIGPTFEDVNRKRAAEVLGIPQTKAELQAFFNEIKLLEPGHFYALGRAITKERLLFHVGGIQTPHGEEALQYETAPPPPLEKVKALLPKLADLPKQAEERARSEAELRKEIRELKAQLRAADANKSLQLQTGKTTKVVTQPKLVADEKAIARATAPLRSLLEGAMKILAKVTATGFEGTALKREDIEQALLKTAQQIAALAESRLADRARQFDRLKREIEQLLARMNTLLEKEEVSVTVDVKRNEPITVTPARPFVRRPADDAADGDLTPQQKRILAGLAEFEALGQTPVPRSWVGAAARQSFKSSTFEKYVARLRSLGLIEYAAGQRIALTEEGRRVAPQPGAPLDTEEIQSRALHLLTPQQQGLLQALIAAHPHFISREELGEKAAQSHLSSTFEKYLAALRSGGMAEYGPNKTVKCADWLFLD